MPLAFSDGQIDIIRNSAEPLHPDQRSAYLAGLRAGRSRPIAAGELVQPARL